MGKWHKLKAIYEKGIIKINNNQNLFLIFICQNQKEENAPKR